MISAPRAMLSPPRLPALCIAFHAGACVTSDAPVPASHTLSDPIWIMRIHASIYTLMQKQKAT